MNKRKWIIIIAAVLLALIVAASAILVNLLNRDEGVGYDGKKEDIGASAPADTDNDKDEDGEQQVDKNNNTKPTTNNKKPIKVNGSYIPLVSLENGYTFPSYTYDLKVTSFNVGGFYHGVRTGMNGDEPDEGMRPWILPNLREWQEDIARYDADIYGLQEFCPTFFYQDSKNVHITAKEAFAKTFKTLKMFEGSTANGNQPMYMALAAHANSGLDITDVTTGHLGAKAPATQRAFMKGYVNVAGKRVAVYSVHLGFTDPVATADSINELIGLMNKEEYCIVMGDMNTDTIIEDMKEAGFNVANGGEFGLFNTYEYSDSSYIDNIFTTPNIDIQFVECEKDKAGGSDHYPLTAYLKLNNVGSTNSNRVEIGNDGFINGWFKP